MSKKGLKKYIELTDAIRRVSARYYQATSSTQARSIVKTRKKLVQEANELKSKLRKDGKWDYDYICKKRNKKY